MTMGHVNGTVIDADGHVLEPRGMWARYLDPKLAELILVPDPATGTRILPSEHNPQARRPHPISGTVGGLVGLAGSVGRRADDALTGKIGYDDGPAGAFDGRARLSDMDTEGIDVAVLYPTSASPSATPRPGSPRASVSRTTTGCTPTAPRPPSGWSASAPSP